MDGENKRERDSMVRAKKENTGSRRSTSFPRYVLVELFVCLALSFQLSNPIFPHAGRFKASFIRWWASGVSRSKARFILLQQDVAEELLLDLCISKQNTSMLQRYHIKKGSVITFINKARLMMFYDLVKAVCSESCSQIHFFTFATFLFSLIYPAKCLFYRSQLS